MRIHLHGLLDHVVEARVFQRSKDVSEVGQVVLRAGLDADREMIGPLLA
jgi:hypothetical protein